MLLKYSQLQIGWHRIWRLFLKTFNLVPGEPGFIIYYWVLIVNITGRILVCWKSFRNNLEILCHLICNRLYQVLYEKRKSVCVCVGEKEILFCWLLLLDYLSTVWQEKECVCVWWRKRECVHGRERVCVREKEKEKDFILVAAVIILFDNCVGKEKKCGRERKWEREKERERERERDIDREKERERERKRARERERERRREGETDGMREGGTDNN